MSEDKIGGEFDRPDRLKVVYLPQVEKFCSGLKIKPTCRRPSPRRSRRPCPREPNRTSATHESSSSA